MGEGLEDRESEALVTGRINEKVRFLQSLHEGGFGKGARPVKGAVPSLKLTDALACGRSGFPVEHADQL